MHKRAEIKTKFVDMLGASGLGATIYNSRYLPVNTKVFPAISVYCPEDTLEIAQSGEHYDRVARVVLCCYALGYDASAMTGTDQRAIDAELDDLTGGIESIFCIPNQTLDGIALQTYLVKTRYAVNDKGETITGIAYMDFDVHYKDLLI